MKKQVLFLSYLISVAFVNAQSPKLKLDDKKSFSGNHSYSKDLVSDVKEDTMKSKINVSAFYIGLGYNFIKKEPSSFNTTFILKNKWGLTYRFTQNDFTAKNLPSDYSSFEDIRFVKDDQIKANSFSISREFQPRTKLIRFGIEAGPSFIKYRRADFTYFPGYEAEGFSFLLWLLTGDGGTKEWVPPRYETNYSYHESVGLNLRTKMEFPLTTRLGFEFAAFGNFNKVKSLTGAEFCLTIGLVRENNKPRLAEF